VMNTVGKPGRLGEQIKCVVSVSMLTEGWDANTVTHILGVRAFGTQLLCEQVVGRGLRRTSYATNDQGMFDPQYAEVYGVPFSFIPSAGSAIDPRPGPMPTRVRALEDRIEHEITFPRVMGYRYDLAGERLTATFNDDSRMALSTADIPSKTEMASILGESSMHKLYGLMDRREQEIDFRLASLLLEKYFRDDDEGGTRPWLFPQLLNIARQWRIECVTCKDDAFPQMLLLTEFAHDAVDHIYRSIVSSSGGEKTLKPILRPYDTVGSTRYVDFDTTRDVYTTDPLKCHISHVALDSNWEAKLAQSLEEMDEVICYVKNQSLGFIIPYTLEGQEHGYIPDYLIKIKLPATVEDGGRVGDGGFLNLILEVSGEARKDKAAKAATARNFWVPAINNHGGFGRWAYLEVTDPWDAKNTIRAFVVGQNVDGVAPLFRENNQPQDK
jgi:type III restriction enzyme